MTIRQLGLCSKPIQRICDSHFGQHGVGSSSESGGARPEAAGSSATPVVPPGILKDLMRHSNIETTMSFYVNITAKDTMAEVRRHLTKSGVTKTVLGDKRGDKVT